MDFNKLNRGDLNNLQNQDLDFDKGAMWANLENRKERRPVFGWMLMFAGVGLALLGSAFFFFENGDANDFSTQIVDNQSIEKVETENISLSDNEKIELVEQEIEQTTIKTEKKLSSNHPSVKESENGFEPKNKSETNSTFIKKELINTRDESLNFQPTQSSIEELKNASIEIQNLTENKNRDLENLDLAESIELKQAFLNVEKKEEFDLPKTVFSKGKKSKSFDLLITPFAGIGYQFQTLKTKGELQNPEYFNARKANEKQFESWSFGFLVDKKITKNLMLGTGIEFVQHNEQLMLVESQTDNIEAFTQGEVPSEFLGREGFLTKEISTIYQNQHRLINVPLNVSWMLNFKKVRFAPTTSLVFNISQKLNGHIQNEAGMTDDLSPYFKSKIGLAYRFGCRVYYPINPRFILFANPQFELNPNDVSNELNPILQKRNTLRLDIGISTKI